MIIIPPPESPTDQDFEDLANQVVESWDLKTLVDYAVTRVVDDYRASEMQFEWDWNTINNPDAEGIEE